MATLGYTTHGANGTAGGTGAVKFTATEAGNITDIVVWAKDRFGPHFFRVAIYADNGSGRPGALLAQSAGSTEITSTGEFACPISYSFTNGEVLWLLAAGDDDDTPGGSGTNVNYAWDVGGTVQNCQKNMTYGSPDNPFGTPTFELDRVYSIYANYTPVGSSRPVGSALL